MKKFTWPTWEELEAEKKERWNNLPKKIKFEFIKDWREFNLEILKANFRDARKKLSLIYGKS